MVRARGVAVWIGWDQTLVPICIELHGEKVLWPLLFSRTTLPVLRPMTSPLTGATLASGSPWAQEQCPAVAALCPAGHTPRARTSVESQFPRAGCLGLHVMVHQRPGEAITPSEKRSPEDKYPPRLFHTPGNTPPCYCGMSLTMSLGERWTRNVSTVIPWKGISPYEYRESLF